MGKPRYPISREIGDTHLPRGSDKKLGYLSLWSGREDPVLGTRGDERN